MKRILLLLLPWMALVTNAYAQSRVAQVIYTHYGPLRETVYRVADECYAPIFAVEAWGWKVRVVDSGVFVKAEGESVYLPIRTIGGRQTIPLKVAFEKIGADAKWDATDTLTVRSPLDSVKVRGTEIQIRSTLEVKPTAFALADPPRLVIDLRGAVLMPNTPLDLDPAAKVTHYQPDTVRITVETPDAEQLVRPIGPNNLLLLSLDPRATPQQPLPVIQAPLDVEAQDPDPSPVEGDPASAGGMEEELSAEGEVQDATIKPTMFVDLENEHSLLLLIRDFGQLTGPIRFRKPSPSTLEVVLPGTYLSLPKDFQLNTTSITAAEVLTEENGSILSLTLGRAMGAHVSANGREVSIQLLKPQVGDGRLAGKIVVVDAGHGGKDTGAKAGGVYEKNLNLAIAKLTAQELAKAGATVLMTRTTDVFVELLQRADLANRNSADLFVSIHINSNKVSNSTSGTITFYHKGSQIGKLLAECIHEELAKVNGLPDIGVWSDGKIYQNGFSVLRNTRMPGVLIEMGFINHSKDRARMTTADFKQKAAIAIVKGLRTFVGDAQE